MATDDVLAAHSALLVALTEKADQQTDHLEAIVAQWRRMHETIRRALGALAQR